MPDEVERFGRYDLVRRIARGGMAEIFLAIEHGIEDVSRYVVIKRILPQVAESHEFIEMFMDEARVAARLSHPNIAQIFQFGEVGGVYYLAMEFVEGMTLSKLIRQHQDQGIPAEMALRIAGDICAGLHHAHELCDEHERPLHVVHRDVSPQNVIVSKSGVAKLLDFGIAHASSKAHITAVGQLKGKLSYMAPEQFIGEGLDRRADVFATGVVLYEMVSGRRLFHREYEAATMRALLQEAPPSVADRAPPEVDDIIRTATAKKITERFETAAAMENAIEALVMKHRMAVTSHGLAAYVKGQIRESRSQPQQCYSNPGTPASLGVIQSPTQERSASSLTPTPSGAGARGLPVDGLPFADAVTVPGLAAGETTPVERGAGAAPVARSALPVRAGGNRRAKLVGAALAAGLVLCAGVAALVVLAARPDPGAGPTPTVARDLAPASLPERPPAAPPEHAPAAPTRVNVTLRGVPADAAVSVDGLPARAAGFTVDADGRPHVVAVAAQGYEPWTRTVSPSSDLEIEVALSPSRRPERRDRPPRGHATAPGDDPDAILVRDPGY
jgi:serine/threonine protein kinase